MVAVDGSDHSEKAYAIAAKIVKAEDEIVFVTVTPKVKEKALESSSKYKQRESAKELLAKWDKKSKEDGINSSTLLLEAEDAREALCEAVEKNSVDILVVGTRGLGTLKRMFLGSVSNYVVQHANCDVIVAK